MRRGQLLLLLLMALASQRAVAQTDAPDYSSYNIAKQYQRDKDYVRCFRYLVTFRVANLKRLQQPANQAALEQLDKQITQMEDYLRQVSSGSLCRESRGFNDGQIDSAYKSRSSKLELKTISIN